MAIGMMKKFIIRKLLEIDLMNIHMGNLISVFSLSVFPFEAGSKNINKDCTAIVSTFISL